MGRTSASEQEHHPAKAATTPAEAGAQLGDVAN